MQNEPSCVRSWEYLLGGSCFLLIDLNFDVKMKEDFGRVPPIIYCENEFIANIPIRVSSSAEGRNRFTFKRAPVFAKVSSWPGRLSEDLTVVCWSPGGTVSVYAEVFSLDREVWWRQFQPMTFEGTGMGAGSDSRASLSRREGFTTSYDPGQPQISKETKETQANFSEWFSLA